MQYHNVCAHEDYMAYESKVISPINCSEVTCPEIRASVSGEVKTPAFGSHNNGYLENYAFSLLAFLASR